MDDHHKQIDDVAGRAARIVGLGCAGHHERGKRFADVPGSLYEVHEQRMEV